MWVFNFTPMKKIGVPFVYVFNYRRHSAIRIVKNITLLRLSSKNPKFEDKIRHNPIMPIFSPREITS